MKEELRKLSEHLNSSREELREVLWQVTSRIVQHSSAKPLEIAEPRRKAA